MSVQTKAGEIVAPGETRKYRHKPRAPSPPGCPLVVYDELVQFGIQFSRKHILDLMRASKFPAARQISQNRVGWLRSEIEAHVAALPIARAAQGADGPAGAEKQPIELKTNGAGFRRGPRAGGNGRA
jgi:predicted DNA-binding transcriptional regulator AlpA